MKEKESSRLTSSIMQVAGMMELAARTAPKTAGKDFVKTRIISGSLLNELSEAMIKFGVDKKKGNFDRDGANVAESSALLLLGIKDAATAGLDCGACGFASCDLLKAAKPVDIEFKGPICVYRHLDLAIAVGSAVKTAQLFNVDNRVMYRPGAVARSMGMVDWDFVLGIPLSATGKSPFFDRKG